MASKPRNAMRNKRRRLFRAMGGRCWYCDRLMEFNTSTLDHLKPRADGGSNGIGNLVLACQGCNEGRAKGAFRNQTAAEYRRWARKQNPANLPPVDANFHRCAKRAMKTVAKRTRTAWWNHGDGLDRPVDFGEGVAA